MKIEVLELEDWMPFGGSHRLELPGGAIAVVASYAGNPRRSNWAGKTALLEAIEWALYGVHRKRYEDDVIHGEAPTTSVRMVLSDGSDIKRWRARGKATVLEVRDAEGVTYVKKAAEERVTSLIGFDGADYRATVGFAQGDTEAIVARTNGERRKIVGAWLGLDAWLRVAARARAEAKVAGETYREGAAALRGREEHLNDNAPTEEESAADIAKMEAAIAAATADLADLETALEAVASREIAKQDAVRLERILAELRDTRADAAGFRKWTEEERRASASALERAAGAFVEAEKEVTTARGLVRGQFDGTCPVTCEGCPVAADVRENVGAARTRLEKARKALEPAREAHDAARAAYQKIENDRRALAQLGSRADALAKQARELRASIEAQGGNDPELSDEEVAALKARKVAANNRLIDARATLRTLEHNRAAAAEGRRWVAEQRLALEVTARELRIANIAARAAGPSGIPAMIAEAALADLEERANVLLQGSGLSFAFAWDRETRDLSPSCGACGYAYKGVRDKACPACGERREMKRADELEILVSDGSGVTEDVRAKSGGAKVLVASAIRLTAGMMLRSSRGARCAWATVDEPFGALDAENRESLAQTFAGLLGSVGLEQAFVVSHDAALLDALPARLEITREGNVSRVVVR